MTPNTQMSSNLIMCTAVAALLGAFSSTFSAQQPPSDRVRRIERGRYLVSIAACHDCHSPKIDAQMTPDPSRLLSGRPATTAPPLQGAADIRASLDLTAWAGPWGNSYAANLTPDEETGIGRRYTESTFVETLRTGRKPEGEALSPPMPWAVYRNMTDEDLKAVYAYLRSLKPVKNFVRASPTARLELLSSSSSLPARSMVTEGER